MKKILFLLTFVACALSSCVQQEYDDTGKKVKGPNDVTFNITLPSNMRNTRAVDAEAGENQVNDLTLIFFDTNTEIFKGYKRYAMQTANPDVTKVDETSYELNVSFGSGSGLSKSDGYSVLAIANMLDGVYFKDADEMDKFMESAAANNKTVSDIRKEMVMYVKGQNAVGYSAAAFKSNNLPMSGSCVKAANTDNADLDLTRSVARFDVFNTVEGYTLTSVSIWNAFSYPTVFEKVNIDYTQAHTEFFYGLETTSGEIKGRLYAPENVVPTPSQNDKKTTCLIVGLTKDGETTPKYFRVNIHPKESGQYLRRNSVYQLTIMGVDAEGEAGERDAYLNGDVILETAINSWDRDEDGLILTNGDNMLALPTTKAVFGPKGETRIYSIYTVGSSTSALSMSVVGGGTLPEGLTANLENKTLTITATDFSGDERGGALEFTFAGMKGVIEIVQTGRDKKQLKLSHSTVPNYPAGGSLTSLIASNPILITSSGKIIDGKTAPWTATILLSNGFSFSKDSEVLELKGQSGDKIQDVFAHNSNSSEKPLINFILITLDEDPDNYRNVVVLTQNASGKYTLTPNVSFVEFNADMSIYTNQQNAFTALSGDNTDNWTVTLGGKNPDKFQLQVNGANVTSPYEKSGAPEVSFTVVPKEVNYTAKYTATVEIAQNGGNRKLINLTQDVYKLTISPKTANVSSKGGQVTFSVVLAASGKKMNATLVNPLSSISEGKYVPKFGDGSTEISGQDVRNITVDVPAISPPYGQKVTTKPTIEVKVNIDGTEMAESVTITQDILEYSKALNSQTLFDSYGGWQNNGQYMMQWWTFMRDASLFGPSGKVWSPSAIGNHHNSWTQMPLADTRIWNINQYGYSSGYANLSSNWRGNEKAVVILSTYSQNDMFQYVFGTGNNGGYTINTSNYNPNNPNLTLTSAPGTSTKTPLWKYLIGGDGPFGAVDVSGITFGGNDNANCSLSGWPSTFIPMIMYQGRCVMGVDPTNRIIWTGETGVFHPYGNAYSSPDSEGSKFLKNLIAYTVNVALYGDTFNNQFKVK